MKNIKKLCIFTIVLGVFMLTINMIFNDAIIPIIHKGNTNGIDYFWIDFEMYIQNLQESIRTNDLLNLSMPTGEWKQINSSIIQGQFWADLGNNMGVILDWIIFAINCLVYPLRIGAYIVKQAYSVLGVDTSATAKHGLTWMVQVIRFLIKLQIPYVMN